MTSAAEESEINIGQMLRDPKVSPADKRGALAEEILHRYVIRTLDDTGEVRYYDNGRYREGGKEKILAELQAIGNYEINNHLCNEVVETIRRMTYTQRSEFDKDPDILNLRNGLLNIKTGQCTGHRSDHLSMVQLPVNWKLEATCREIIEFLYDVIADPSDVPLLLEYLAYCLFEDKDMQKELMLVGPPDSGKSKLLDLMTAFLGSANVSNVTMQQLSTNRFALAQLYGKRANIYADISHARLEDIERFKAIATGDEVEAEKKGMQLFKFRPRAKLIYSANIPPRPPITVDDSYYRRWMLVPCALRDEHYFSKSTLVRDPKILAKLTTDQQLSGLLSLVLISARRLLKKQKFCKSPPVDKVREEYDRLSNPVQMWVDSCCEQDEAGYVEKDTGYLSYVRFCKDRKIGATTREWLGKELARLGHLEGKRGDSRKHQVKAWLGLKLKDMGTGNGSFPSLTYDVDSIIEKGKGALPSPKHKDGAT